MLRPVIKIRLGYGTFVCFSTFTRLIYCHIYNLLFYYRKYYLNESLQLIFYKSVYCFDFHWLQIFLLHISACVTKQLLIFNILQGVSEQSSSRKLLNVYGLMSQFCAMPGLNFVLNYIYLQSTMSLCGVLCRGASSILMKPMSFIPSKSNWLSKYSFKQTSIRWPLFNFYDNKK